MSSEEKEGDKIKVTYRSSNSGGRWRLSDEKWKALEDAGWNVEWRRERWLGALATEASKNTEGLKDAIREFEKITEQDTSDKGCACCGPPHSFSWGTGGDCESVSGDDILNILYGEGGEKTKRQLLEERQNEQRK